MYDNSSASNLLFFPAATVLYYRVRHTRRDVSTISLLFCKFVLNS